jgi:hypothetical protein
VLKLRNASPISVPDHAAALGVALRSMRAAGLDGFDAALGFFAFARGLLIAFVAMIPV